MRKNRFIILTIILFLLNIVLSLKIMSLKNRETTVKSTIDFQPISFSLQESYMLNMQELVNTNLTNSENKIIDLYSLIEGRKTLVLIYSDKGCNSCLETLILECNSLFTEGNLHRNIFGIAEAQSVERVQQNKLIKGIEFPVYFCTDNNFPSDLKISTLPVALMIDEKRTIINSFFINPYNNELSSAFFNAAKSFLKESDRMRDDANN